MPGPQLPDLQQQILDDATLARLVDDIARLTTIREVRGKLAPHAHSVPDALGLADAVALLRQSKLRGVQIVYDYAGQTWLDTLLAAGGGIRLIRIAQQDGSS